jgi:predicted acyl esterase
MKSIGLARIGIVQNGHSGQAPLDLQSATGFARRYLQPLTPGEIYRFEIEIMPTANLFMAGHRIGLKIKGAADDPPKTMFHFINSPHLLSQTPNRVAIYHDADHPSHLLLPITRGNVVGTFISGGDISVREPKMT